MSTFHVAGALLPLRAPAITNSLAAVFESAADANAADAAAIAQLDSILPAESLWSY